MKKINTKEIRKAYEVYVMRKDVYYATKSGNYSKENDYAHVLEAEKQFDVVSEKLSAAITEAEGRARVRTITVRDICKALARVEKRLNITKKAMEGVTICIDDNAQNFPNCYHGRPESTVFKAEYHNGNWYITDIYRTYTSRANHGYTIHLTEEAKQTILEKISEF